MDSTVILLIYFGERTKKIITNRASLNLGTLTGMIKEKCVVQDFFCQYFDNDLEEYIDIDNEAIAVIADYKVIKIKVKTNERRQPLLAIDVDERESTASLSGSPSPVPSTSSGKDVNPFPLNTPDSAHAIPSTSTLLCTPKSVQHSESNEYESKNRKLWPRLYSLPKNSVPRCVVQKLDNQAFLNKSDRRLLLDGIYHDVTTYANGMYPSPAMYDDIVDGLLREYPYLIVMTELPASSARVYWKEKLLNKFVNSRRRIDMDSPEVKAKKRKKDHTVNHVDVPEHLHVWGLSNFMPDTPPLGEDEESISRHKEWLKREIRKLSPDELGISKRMDITFYDRRQMVVKDGKTIHAIMDNYPCLSIHTQLMKEFERLGPNTSSNLKDLESLFVQGLDKYVTAILQVARPKKQENTLLKSVLDSLAGLHVDEQRKYTRRVAAVLAVPSLFKEKMSTVLVSSENSNDGNVDARMIYKKSVLAMEEQQFLVEAEDVTISRCDNFIDMVMAYIATVYCFNLAYPKKIEKTMLFFQKVIMGIMDNTSGNVLDKKLLNVVSELNRAQKD